VETCASRGKRLFPYAAGERSFRSRGIRRGISINKGKKSGALWNFWGHGNESASSDIYSSELRSRYGTTDKQFVGLWLRLACRCNKYLRVRAREERMNASIADRTGNGGKWKKQGARFSLSRERQEGNGRNGARERAIMLARFARCRTVLSDVRHGILRCYQLASTLIRILLTCIRSKTRKPDTYLDVVPSWVILETRLRRQQ